MKLSGKMDSGIESTENSNGSITENPLISDKKINSEAIGLGLPFSDRRESFYCSNVSERNFEELAESDMTEDCSSSKQRPGETNVEVELDCRSGPHDSENNFKPVDENEQIQENSEEKLKNVESIPVPEGSRLQLNFSSNLPVTYEDIDLKLNISLRNTLPFTLGNQSNLIIGNSSEECNPVNYYGPFALVPYACKKRERKFKNYRQRLRQLKEYLPRKEKRLRTATSLNNVELVMNLLNDGVNPNSIDDRRRTPLHIAASKGYSEIVRLLLQHCADPNQKDIIGNTPLHLAACTSHIETVTLLLKAGTDVKLEDNLGFSPLSLANSRLKLMKFESSPSAEVRKQVLQIIEMMEAYMKSAGNTEDAEVLASLTNKLSLTNSSKEGGEEDLKSLLDSLQSLTLNKSKKFN